MNVRIGFSGGPGSFSEAAALQFIERKSAQCGHNPLTMPLLTAPRVYDHLVRDQIDFGVVPIENSIHGVVAETREAQALHGHLTEEIDRFTMTIEQCLIVQPGVHLSDIKLIIGHPQALGQSYATREKILPGIPTQEWQDTADAVRALAQAEFPPHTAVVASRRAAELYGMDVLQVVNDRADNETTFILIRKKAL